MTTSFLRRSAVPLALILGSLIVGYGAIEAGLFAAAGFGARAGVARYQDLYVSSRPIAVFDRIMGYRRPRGPTRIVRIVQDQLAFDHTFTPNNAGYISARDYSYAKPSPDTVRFIVFGDSFTAEEFNAVPWPDRVQDALAHSGLPNVELYSFAVNGAGLANWHSIFVNDVIQHYAFDGVIIADFGDDLAREFSILHYDGPTAYTARFPTQPVDDADFFANYLPKMPRHPVEVASNAEIDRMIADLHGTWRWPGVHARAPGMIAQRWQIFSAQHKALKRLAATARLVESTELTGMDEIENTYGPQQMGFLKDMIAYCHAHQIPVVMASVPTREGAKNVAAAHGQTETAQEREVKSLAHHLGTLHFDGHHPFSVVKQADIDRIYWLKGDPHWNQAGSDLFAAAMTAYLREHIAQFQSHDVAQSH